MGGGAGGGIIPVSRSFTNPDPGLTSQLTEDQKRQAAQLEALRIKLLRSRGRGLLTQNVPNSTLG